MREIKFRGKQLEDIHETAKTYASEKGTWRYGTYKYIHKFYDGVNAHMICDIYGREIMCDKNTIGQYTGLKDKNGVEIYEGDKLKVVNRSILISDGTSNMSCETRVYEIVFHEHAFMGKLIEYGIPHLKVVENYDPIYHDLIGMMDDIEVIGNIHEEEVK